MTNEGRNQDRCAVQAKLLASNYSEVLIVISTFSFNMRDEVIRVIRTIFSSVGQNSI